MADTLLTNSTLLAIKFPTAVQLPAQGKSNSAVVKTVVDLIKYLEPKILFAGEEACCPQITVNDKTDTVLIKIHVIDAPSVIDFTRPDNEIVKWFLKQLRSNKQHIVLQNSSKIGAVEQSVIDIYVRGVFIQKKQTIVKRMDPHSNIRLNYAV